MLAALLMMDPSALGASPDSVSQPTSLTSAIRVSAKATGYVVVSLPRAVQDKDGYPQLVEDWQGGASAVVLAPDRPDVFDPKNPPPTLVIPNLVGRSVNPHPYVFIGLDPRHHQPAFFYHRVPAGRYRLYVVTTAPAQVTLRLPGLPRGFTRVVASTPGHAVTFGTHQRASVGSLPPAFSYGATGRLTSHRGLIWTVQWMHSPVRVSEDFGACTYAPPPASPEVYHFPSCALAPGGNLVPAVGAQYIGYVPPPDLLHESEHYGVPPGPVGVQSYVAVTGPVSHEGAELLWLSW